MRTPLLGGEGTLLFSGITGEVKRFKKLTPLHPPL